MGDDKVLIIAEAGVIHNGSLELAKKLAKTARDCGADIVKFQTAKASSLVSKNAKMAEYQKTNIGKEMSQLKMLEKLLLSFDDFRELAEYCKQIGIRFLSTPFDLESLRFLDDLGCDLWKIPSGEITNYPYLVAIGKTKKSVILSTGMSELQEIEEAIEVLQKNGTENITILHCNTQYPTPYADVNLRAMQTLHEELKLPVGYSDHTKGIEVPIAAVSMGAKVIEKHFTLDRNMEGPDHKASLEPDELRAMVETIRHIEVALGDGIKRVTDSERANKSVVRKSIIASRDIKKGEIFSEENLTTKRPGDGISPMNWNALLGRKAQEDYVEDDQINPLELE